MGGFKDAWGNCVKTDVAVLKKYMTTVCPVNTNAEVIMPDKTFRSICAIHAIKHRSPMGNWCKPRKGIESCCSLCTEREKIAGGAPFTPPKGVTIAELGADGKWIYNVEKGYII